MIVRSFSQFTFLSVLGFHCRFLTILSLVTWRIRALERQPEISTLPFSWPCEDVTCLGLASPSVYTCVHRSPRPRLSSRLPSLSAAYRWGFCFSPSFCDQAPSSLMCGIIWSSRDLQKLGLTILSQQEHQANNTLKPRAEWVLAK